MLNRSQFRDRRIAVDEDISGLTFDEMTLPVVDSPTHENIASTLHRINKPIAVILAGETNAGKTSLVKHLFTEEMFRKRYDGSLEDEPQPSWDLSDVTTPISRLPLGIAQNPKGIVLYDTPDLASDSPAIDNTARVALGMEQRAPKLQEVEFRAYNLPDDLHGSAQFDEKTIPVDDVRHLLKKDGELTCIYVVNAAVDALKPEALAEKVTWLREQFEGKVIFAKTFQDKLEAWQNTPMEAGGKGRKDRRDEDLDAILGKDAVWVNGRTGEGIDGLVNALLKLHGCQGSIGTSLSVELKRQRLFSASLQITGLLIPAFFSRALAEEATTQLPYLLSFLAGAVRHLVSTEEPSQNPEIQATFEEKVKRFTEALKKSAVEEKFVSRIKDIEEMGFWEKLIEISGSVFTRLPPGFRYINVTELSRTPEVLAELYYWMYSLLYEMDKMEDVSVIETPKVPAAAGRKWFLDKFQVWKERFPSFSGEHPESTAKLWEFYHLPGDGEYGLAFFLGFHHPEAVPVRGIEV